MNILLLHDYGLSGKVLLERLKTTDLTVTPLLVSRPDQVKPAELIAWIPAETQLIVNLLSPMLAEVAEENPEGARHQLFTLPMALAEHCQQQGIALFHLSSFYIFDGRKQGPYLATNPGQPFSQIGIWQWECEQAFRTLLPRHFILRTGWRLENLIRRAMAVTHACTQLSCRLAWSSHYQGQPLGVRDLARVVTAMLLQVDAGAEVWGTYQYAGAEVVTLHELGLDLVPLLSRPDCQLDLVDESASWMSLEPENARLGCVRIRNTFGIKQQSWRATLAEEIALVCSVADTSSPAPGSAGEGAGKSAGDSAEDSAGDSAER